MFHKFVTWGTFITFTFVSLFLYFPAPTSTALAQVAEPFSFKKDLRLGDTDPDVKALQKVLNTASETAVAITGPGSTGQESDYFGNLTQTAVIKFQKKYQVTANGQVDKATRTQLNLLIGVSVTVDSVGLPQSRTATATTAPPPITTPSSSGMSVCQFVDLMVTIEAVTTVKATEARVTLGCTTVAPPVVVTSPPTSGGVSVCQFVDLMITIGVVSSSNANQARNTLGCSAPAGTPSVDLKANDSNGPITVKPGDIFELSWKSTDTVSCSDGLNTLPTSGHSNLIANITSSYPVACTGVNGTSVVDAVMVIVSTSTTSTTDSNQATSSIIILSSQITPGYNYVDIQVTTNIATKAIMTYTNTPTVASSIKTFTSATSTVHSDRITGLTPSSTYYLLLGLSADNNVSVISDEVIFTTLSDPSLAAVTTTSTSDVSQKVLSSAGGNGIVTVRESESLKTKNTVTLEAWVKPIAWNTVPGMSSTNDSVIIAKGNIGGNIDYSLALDNGKLVYNNSDASLFSCSAVVPLNQWTHVAATVSESSQNISLYVNGQKITSICEGARGVFSRTAKINKANAITEYVATTTSAYTSGWGFGTISTSSPVIAPVITGNVYFANYYPQSCGVTEAGNGFIGLIDDIRIWNTARTSTEINSDFSAIASTVATTTITSYTALLASYSQPAGLVGHWTFDNGQATDLTYNSNNGALKGDISILDDESAVSVVASPTYSVSTFETNFPESCDASIYPDLAAAVATSTLPAGYEIAFKGGVKSVASSPTIPGAQEVTLETCDDPREDLVKSITVIGEAPPKSPSYYNNIGMIAVTIAAGLGMNVPKERDTIEGSAIDYLATPVSSNANSVGSAATWTPVEKTCMKKDDSILGMDKGTFMIVAAVAAVVVIAVVCTGCLAAMTSYLPYGVPAGTGGIGVVTASGTYGTGAVVGGIGTLTTAQAAAGSAAVIGGSAWAGSRMECAKGDTGCY